MFTSIFVINFQFKSLAKYAFLRQGELRNKDAVSYWFPSFKVTASMDVTANFHAIIYPSSLAFWANFKSLFNFFGFVSFFQNSLVFSQLTTTWIPKQAIKSTQRYHCTRLYEEKLNIDLLAGSSMEEGILWKTTRLAWHYVTYCNCSLYL